MESEPVTPATVGNITIEGGTVKACGTDGGPGIGGTYCGLTGNVTINGGAVYAEGSYGYFLLLPCQTVKRGYWQLT